MVLELARRGGDVAFTYRRGVQAAEEVLAATAAVPGWFVALEPDLLDGDAPALVAAVGGELGTIDGLVLNAASATAAGSMTCRSSSASGRGNRNLSHTVLRPFGAAEEIARAAVFLAEEAA